MAALYLHNALFTPEPSSSSRSDPPTSSQHARHYSSQSLATLHTSTSSHSHPTEPLLRSETSESLAYLDILSRQPMHPNEPSPGLDLGLTLTGDQTSMLERKGYWERRVRKRLRRLKLAKFILQSVIGSWAVYNTIRYFIAFAIHPSNERQAFALALGISTTLTTALLLASALISIFSHYLSILFALSRRRIEYTRAIMHYISSFLLFAPAVIAFALVFVWRTNTDLDVGLQFRCHWDIDVVWAGIDATCNPTHPPSFVVWLVASIVRLLLTMAILALYHTVSLAYTYTRRPSRRRSFLRRHLSQPSFSALSTSTQTFASSNAASPPSQPSQSHQPRVRYSSDSLYEHSPRTSTPTPTSRSLTASIRNLLVSHSSSHSDPVTTRSSPPGSSNGTTATATDTTRPLHSNSPSTDDSPPGPSMHDLSTDPHSFIDRFRALVSQITRETEDGLAFAHTDADNNTSPYTDHDPFFSHDAFDDYNRPVSPDRVIVMGGYIRRLPTIESLGSREAGMSAHRAPGLGSSGYASSSASASAYASAPPTSSITLASGPPSRGESTTSAGHAQSFYGVVSEMGELGDGEDGQARPPNSWSTTSYYTAHSTPGVMPEHGEEKMGSR